MAITTKQNYKQTDIGIIPEDWEVRRLGEIADIKMGQSPLSEFYNDQNVGLPLVQGNADIKNRETIIRSYTSKITKQAKIGDIIMSVRAPVGEIARATFDCCIGRGVCAIDYKNNYLFHYLIDFENSWSKISTGSTFDSINSTEVKNLQIPLPPLPEQIAIATVLSDTDELITSLTQLIAKKKQIKIGTMQKLLKPQEGWEVKKLGEILDYEQPTKYLVTDTEYLDNAKTPVLTAGKTFVLGYTNEEFGIFDNLPVIIFDDFTTATKYVDFPFKVKSSAMKMLIPRDKKTNLKLIFELMNRVDFLVGDHKRHWISEYQNLTIPFPPLSTQTQIATILTDMDEEIQALESKLSKYHLIKQGMMQELLTGRIRLV
jgi:type I restriction enzyme, S subunit